MRWESFQNAFNDLYPVLNAFISTSYSVMGTQTLDSVKVRCVTDANPLTLLVPPLLHPNNVERYDHVLAES